MRDSQGEKFAHISLSEPRAVRVLPGSLYERPLSDQVVASSRSVWLIGNLPEAISRQTVQELKTWKLIEYGPADSYTWVPKRSEATGLLLLARNVHYSWIGGISDYVGRAGLWTARFGHRVR